VKFSGSVDTVFNSILNASIIYGKCTTRDHSISNITINEYCRQDSRSFKIKDYNYNFNVIKCDNKTGELEITYSVPFDNSKVILSMVDILGQEINLINDFSNEGEYKKVIDLNSFTSGVYILVYKNSGFTDAKKIYIGK